MSRSSGPCCAVIGCSNNWRKINMWKESPCEIHENVLHKYCPCLVPFTLHRFPKEDRMRQSWIDALQRKNYNPKKYGVVCGIHFVGGIKTNVHPVPTLHLGHNKYINNRNEIITNSDSIDSNIQENECNVVTDENAKYDAISDENLYMDTCTPADVVMIDDYIKYDNLSDQHVNCTRNNLYIDACIQSNITTKDACTQYEDPLEVYTCYNRNNLRFDACTQTDFIMKNASTQYQDRLEDHIYFKRKERKEKPSELTSTAVQTNYQHFMQWTPSEITDADCKFYIGLTLCVFQELVSALLRCAKMKYKKLSVFDKIFIVLARLRLGLLYKDLSRRSGVSTAVVCKIIKFWIPVMASEMKVLVQWLPRETTTMPPLFKQFYPATTCIIDCMEIYTEKPKLLYNRAVTYSTYKAHNTFKLLIAIAPNGMIMFVSDCYGGRASDRFITAKCGILNYLLPGDSVMVDREFTIQDMLPHGVSINIPSFTKGRQQLPEEEVTICRRISSLRVHVERAIRKLRTYRILKGTLSLKITDNIDDIIFICAALYNLQKPVIKQSA